MKKSISILIGLLLGIVTLFGAFGCSSGTKNDLQSKVDELQSQLEEMERRIAEMNEQLRERDASIQDLDGKLAEMDEQIRKRDEKIKQLEKELEEMHKEDESVGTFYSLQEAYDYSYLTKEDLNQIAYYINNEFPYPQILESNIEDIIKEAAAYEIRNRKIDPILDATADGFAIVQYYGVYSDGYAIRMRNDYDLHPEDVPSYWEEIGGVQFHFTGYDSISVWRAK